MAYLNNKLYEISLVNNFLMLGFYFSFYSPEHFKLKFTELFTFVSLFSRFSYISTFIMDIGHPFILPNGVAYLLEESEYPE